MTPPARCRICDEPWTPRHGAANHPDAGQHRKVQDIRGRWRSDEEAQALIDAIHNSAPPPEQTTITLDVRGTPAPKGSRIPGRRKDGTIYTRPASKGEKAWTEAVAQVARSAGWLPPPYHVAIRFFMPTPKKPSHPHPTRGDLDKLVRATVDGLEVAGLIDNDSHVIELVASKRFGAIPGALIEVSELVETTEEAAA